MHVNKGSGDRRERRHLETRMAGEKEEQQGREETLGLERLTAYRNTTISVQAWEGQLPR